MAAGLENSESTLQGVCQLPEQVVSKQRDLKAEVTAADVALGQLFLEKPGDKGKV